MKKYVSLFMVIFALFVILPFKVCALETFSDGNKTYTIEDKQVDCIKDLYFGGEDEDGNYIFHEMETFNYYRLVSDNSCQQLSNQEILDINDEEFAYYRLEKNSSDGYDIVKETSSGNKFEYLIKTKDVVPDNTKQYYLLFGDSGSGTAPMPLPDNENMSEYYERIYLDYPDSANIDSNVTYYKLGSHSQVVEEVTNPVSSDILSYYVLSDGVTENKEIVKTLPDLFNSLIGENIAEVYMENDTDGFIYIADEPMQPGKLYSLDGELLFEDASYYEKVGDLYVVTRYELIFGENEDTYVVQTKFYNLDRELLYTQDFGYDYLNVTSDSNVINGIAYKNEKNVLVTITKSLDDVINITYKLNNISSSNNDTVISLNQDYSTNLEALDGYKLPDSFIVSVGGNVVSSDQYSYDAFNGELLIPGLVVIDDIVIEASGIQLIVEESEEENPKTYDGTLNYVLIGSLSLIGLIGGTIYLNRKNKVGAN